jgi:hypothetical protein
LLPVRNSTRPFVASQACEALHSTVQFQIPSNKSVINIAYDCTSHCQYQKATSITCHPQSNLRGTGIREIQRTLYYSLHLEHTNFEASIEYSNARLVDGYEFECVTEQQNVISNAPISELFTELYVLTSRRHGGFSLNPARENSNSLE